jgi:hypothetical protein
VIRSPASGCGDLNVTQRGREYPSLMDKKEINSPKLTEHFLFWICGLGLLLLAILFAHFVYHVF